MQFLNGKTVPTGLAYDWELNAPLTPAQDAHLFNTLDVATPVMFPGSDLTGFPNLGPFFQIIGGTLTYREGWRHDLTLAPAPGTVSTLTVDQLVTNPTPTLDQYSPEITIYDLGSVQTGAA